MKQFNLWSWKCIVIKGITVKYSLHHSYNQYGTSGIHVDVCVHLKALLTQNLQVFIISLLFTNGVRQNFEYYGIYRIGMSCRQCIWIDPQFNDSSLINQFHSWINIHTAKHLNIFNPVIAQYVLCQLISLMTDWNLSRFRDISWMRMERLSIPYFGSIQVSVRYKGLNAVPLMFSKSYKCLLNCGCGCFDTIANVSYLWRYTYVIDMCCTCGTSLGSTTWLHKPACIRLIVHARLLIKY